MVGYDSVVDSLSCSSLHRLLEPSILMEMTLSDGSVKTFEVCVCVCVCGGGVFLCLFDCHFLCCQVTVSQFHELRYSVAYVLKEMEDLENRNILKLQD